MVFINKPYTITSDNPNWEDALAAIKAKNWDKLKSALDVEQAIVQYSHGKVKVLDGSILYNNNTIHNCLVDRILEFKQEGLPFEPLVAFLDNLMANPSSDSRDELYLFLEKGKMPITPDGCFLAYKRVKDNYDSFTESPDGTFHNHRPGKKPQMKREDCDPNRNSTCSRGLHFCSHGYLPGFNGGQGRVVVLKINPMNVVSIPSDCSDSKGRACEYEVVSELEREKAEKENILNGQLWEVDKGKKTVRPVKVYRDRHGHFISKARYNKQLADRKRRAAKKSAKKVSSAKGSR